MQQIVDLQRDPTFQALGVPVVSLAFDPVGEQAPEAESLGIDPTYLLSDGDGAVSQAYGVLEWAVPTGEPGHTFVLVGPDGEIVWVRDYGAEENGGRMYVPIEELVEAVAESIG